MGASAGTSGRFKAKCRGFLKHSPAKCSTELAGTFQGKKAAGTLLIQRSWDLVFPTLGCSLCWALAQLRGVGVRNNSPAAPSHCPHPRCLQGRALAVRRDETSTEVSSQRLCLEATCPGVPHTSALSLFPKPPVWALLAQHLSYHVSAPAAAG